MRVILTCLLAFLTLSPVLPAQGSSPTEAEQQPQWLVDFSNLPRDERDQYLRSFQQAKIAYQRGEWVTCIRHLTDCEMIFRGNPNVWNLRACCLLEQRYFDEAAEELERVRQALPDDPVTVMNIANLQLARGQYKECIATLQELRSALPYGTPQELLYTVDFRELLCRMQMGQVEEARALVKGLTPMSDTPLYYYAQAVFAQTRGEHAEAARNLRIAGSIFAKGSALIPYQRALALSGIMNRQAQ